MITIEKRLAVIVRRKTLIPQAEFLELLKIVNAVLENENPNYRPCDPDNLPGGLIALNPRITTIIVPDLHARFQFIYSLVMNRKRENLSLLAEKKLQILCLGDGLHSEGHIGRWLSAYEEYKSGYRRHHHMDEEMINGLATMEIVMMLKCAFPRFFHYLKGNHDNIANETGNGNYGFYKHADEGSMVKAYVMKFFGKQLFDEYYRFEKNLPVLASGGCFLASHAEPADFFPRQAVVNYRKRPDVVKGLTWTDNDAAAEGSVARMLAHYIKPEFRASAFYFGGHRPVSENYYTRAGGKYVQFHNPRQFNYIVIEPGKAINPDKAVRILE